MFDLKNIAIDTEAEIGGVWHDVGDGLRLKIARYNNPEYVRVFNKLVGPYRRMAQTGTLPGSKQAELAAEAMSRTILLDWDGLYIEGRKLDYSQLQAQALLAEPKYSTFFSLVMSLAQDEAAYRAEEVETEVGEFPTTSAGG